MWDTDFVAASGVLTAAFLDGARTEAVAAGEAASPAAAGVDDALEATLADAVGVGRAAWPSLELDAAAFCRFLGARAPAPLDPARPLGALAVADLYLAAGCATGDPRALAECDLLIQREATVAADAARVHASVRDEAIQVARTLLFLPRPERPPAIHDYAGRGPLRGWLRVVLSRELIRVGRSQNRAVELEEQLVDSPDYDDPALDHLKQRYRAELAEAFRIALDTLPARDRTLLRQQIVDGLSIDEIGALHRVHRATAARWLVKLRDDLVERTRAVLADRLGIATDEAASIVRLVQSQLDVSVIRHLRE